MLPRSGSAGVDAALADRRRRALASGAAAGYRPGMEWQAMQRTDLPAVMALAGAVHPHYPEGPEVFAERLALAPGGCFVLGRPLAGYLVSHPWRAGGPPPLNSLLGGLPAAAASWHLHDIAVAPAARRAGHGASGLRAAFAAARAAGFRQLSLVAIGGQGGYWRRQGFSPAACSDAAALRSYGAEASWMRCDLPP